jgi:flagellar hook protein FlgE
VDLTKEMTDMIIVQRSFQSSSRIVSVTDSLLEEITNLKR